MQRVSIQDLMKILELPSREFEKIKSEKTLQDFKNLIKQQRRFLAKKYHPDKENGSLEKMKQVNQICDLFLTAKIQYRQQIVRYSVKTWTSTASTTATSYTATGDYYY